MPRLISINVGGPREVPWRGKLTKTSIFKDPIKGAAKVGKLNIEGDKQSDPRYHGGPDKAVYAYPSEHYEFWRQELELKDLPWGSFGENLTTEGLLETDLSQGDLLRIGEVELAVTDPREPCFKLAIRFGRADIVKRFQKSARCGFYLSVAKEGVITAGDAITVIRKGNPTTIAEAFKRKR
jgi:MOSC domain-containing protein YiiM